ncbi:MAG: phenylalanine--tRNA ligase subunit alpha [Chlamydiae bacterium RIFCSPHIGHO2_12_FULL_49_11]|nr:MAG: phenylalanine--tRNA ligase subunit alpha [Chlamydiae bacterium RIFCSPHIGHO2_12_FULL_49_11]
MSAFERVEKEKKTFVEQLKTASSTKEIEELRIRYLGKKGSLASFVAELRALTSDEKRDFGKAVNDLKIYILNKLDEKNEKLVMAERSEMIESEKIDVSLPGVSVPLGGLHPLTQMMDRVKSVLTLMGFTEFLSPELESEYYNYGGLNYPDDHPARDMQDTYYIDETTLLRSHNTAFQQRIMEKEKPPIRSFCMGKCYRNETISSRSHVIFHQVDVLYIDKNVSLADMMATKTEYYKRILGSDIKLRFRPSYFPFVEPGVEVDIACLLCGGKGCRLCKHSGYLEVCGAGMVHPEVLRQGGLDPELVSGYAWGGGIERLLLMMRGIDDIRLFLQNDIRFLAEFK